MFKNLKNWLLWKAIGKKLDIFISTNCELLLEEFPDIDYLEFVFRGKKYHFERVSKTINN
jgi:hypothetical protein